MNRIKKGKFNLPLLILVIAAFFFALIFYANKSSAIQHVSKDLKISLSYPKGWYIDDRYRSILLTNYQTNQNRDDKPTESQIRVMISNASLCQQSLDQEVLRGGCREGEDTENQILAKKVKNLQSGSFITYRIRYPIGQEDIWYYLQSQNRIIQISKEPDPSKYEKEFEEIVNSIRFL